MTFPASPETRVVLFNPVHTEEVTMTLLREYGPDYALTLAQGERPRRSRRARAGGTQPT